MMRFIMQSVISKKGASAAGLGLVVVLAVLFRQDISRLLHFGGAVPDDEDGLTRLIPSVFPIQSFDPSVTEEPDMDSGLPSQLPVYRGRDPEEVRPDADEVKLFTEEQKQEIYRAIGNQGKAVNENPDYFNGWIQVGLLKKVIGDFEGARDAWEYAGLIRPQNSVSFANLGELYWRYLRDYPKSEANFRRSIANNSADSTTYASLSDLYYYSYKEKAHLTDNVLLQGLAANPESGDLMKHLARRYEELGEYQKAIGWWEKALVHDPGNTQIAAVIESLKKKVQ